MQTLRRYLRSRYGFPSRNGPTTPSGAKAQEFNKTKKDEFIDNDKDEYEKPNYNDEYGKPHQKEEYEKSNRKDEYERPNQKEQYEKANEKDEYDKDEYQNDGHEKEENEKSEKKGENEKSRSEKRKKEEGYRSSKDQRWKIPVFKIGALATVGLVVGQFYLGHRDNYLSELSMDTWYYNAFFYNMMIKSRQGLRDFYEFLASPPVPKFLPDQPPVNPMMHLKTLVLNFEGTLVSKDFEAGSGVMLHLRPDLMNFLQEVSKVYEVVIYTNEDSQFLTEAIMTIDPMQRYFRWAFGRDYFVINRGKTIKDLRRLNRDMRKVVVVDMDTEFYTSEIPENLILLKKYSGEIQDDNLVALRKFLMHLARPDVKDVRKEIQKFGGTNAVENYIAEMKTKIERINRSRGFLGKQRGGSH